MKQAISYRRLTCRKCTNDSSFSNEKIIRGYRNRLIKRPLRDTDQHVGFSLFLKGKLLIILSYFKFLNKDIVNVINI